jgi:CheY-like chemotaxis protein
MKPADLILLVDDDLVDVMTVKRAFRELNGTNPLHITGNGEEALSFLNNTNQTLPKLILVDLNMPRMNGIELIQYIKNDQRLCSIPIVVLTTSQEPQDIRKSYNLSVAGYIVKSIKFTDFVSALKTVYEYWLLCEYI